MFLEKSAREKLTPIRMFRRSSPGRSVYSRCKINLETHRKLWSPSLARNKTNALNLRKYIWYLWNILLEIYHEAVLLSVARITNRITNCKARDIRHVAKKKLRYSLCTYRGFLGYRVNSRNMRNARWHAGKNPGDSAESRNKIFPRRIFPNRNFWRDDR